MLFEDGVVREMPWGCNSRLSIFRLDSLIWVVSKYLLVDFELLILLINDTCI